MRIAVATDHAGFSLKEVVLAAVRESGHEPLDLGTYSQEKVDYPDYAVKVADAILNGQAERGIALCGSGVGICIAANKIPGIYASVCHDTYSAHQGVEHDGMNVLCLGGRVIGPQLACEIVHVYLAASQIQEERFLRRLDKVKILESRNFRG